MSFKPIEWIKFGIWYGLLIYVIAFILSVLFGFFYGNLFGGVFGTLGLIAGITLGFLTVFILIIYTGIQWMIIGFLFEITKKLKINKFWKFTMFSFLTGLVITSFMGPITFLGLLSNLFLQIIGSWIMFKIIEFNKWKFPV